MMKRTGATFKKYGTIFLAAAVAVSCCGLNGISAEAATQPEPSESVEPPEESEVPGFPEISEDAEAFVESEQICDDGETIASEEESAEEAAFEIERYADTEDLASNPVGTLTMEYDDHVSLASYLDENDLTGYTIKEIEKETPTSYQVVGGAKTDAQDTNVLMIEESGTDVVAVGVGTAELVLCNDAEEEVTLSVEVQPATLTLLLIGGQSNAEGRTSSSSGAHPEDSVLCPEGEVYSTYLPSSTSRGKEITGLSKMTACTSANTAESYVAASLTGTTSRAGTTLIYPLTALTASGQGKTGPDSGLAYEWNQLTGDKVWVVNAAWSASNITSWIPGGASYQRAVAAYRAAEETVEAEVAAGHYQSGNTLLFWLQGEQDSSMLTEEYLNDFQSMYNGMQEENLGVEYCGIIVTRAAQDNHTTAEDLYMTGPRVAQYMMGNSTSYPNIYVVSNVNEQWVSDSGVKNYFQSVYGEGSLSYPLRSNTTLTGLPTKVTEVHSDIHYAQVGHNENGLTAAENMYHVVKGGGQSVSSVSWHDQDGATVSSGSTCTLKTTEDCTYVPVVIPLYCSKQVTVSTSSSCFSYHKTTGSVTFSGVGSGTLQAAAGDCSSSITLSVSFPVLQSAKATSSGTKITWSKVSGANGYAVFRKKSGGSWKRIATTTSTSYTDKSSLTNGKKYYYTVRSYTGKESTALKHTYSSTYWSSYDKTGIQIVYTQTPSLKTSVTNTTSGIKVKWKKVSGVSGYSIYRKTKNGSWKQLATTTSTSYTDKTAKAGKTYYYTVRAYRENRETALANTYDARYWSGYASSGVSGRFLETPTLKSATKSSSGTKVKWSKVSGASGYAVYRKKSGGSWQRIATTTSTSYTDKSTLTDGKKYYYTVRAYRGKKATALKKTYRSTYWSSYDSKGILRTVK